MTIAKADLAGRCSTIELLVLDVDGVLTDGVIAVDDLGVETKHFHVRDGAGIALWRRAGKKVAILSGRSARCVAIRAAELGIDPVIQGAVDKRGPFRSIVAGFGLQAHQACHVGDDLADLAPFDEAGLAACPADAAAEVVTAAHLISRFPGGRGAVRDVVEAILKHQGAWDDLVASLRARP